jgi:acyl-coenzyme A thioesterase PaaI-like protein
MSCFSIVLKLSLSAKSYLLVDLVLHTDFAHVVFCCSLAQVATITTFSCNMDFVAALTDDDDAADVSPVAVDGNRDVAVATFSCNMDFVAALTDDDDAADAAPVAVDGNRDVAVANPVAVRPVQALVQDFRTKVDYNFVSRNFGQGRHGSVAERKALSCRMHMGKMMKRIKSDHTKLFETIKTLQPLSRQKLAFELHSCTGSRKRACLGLEVRVINKNATGNRFVRSIAMSTFVDAAYGNPLTGQSFVRNRDAANVHQLQNLYRIC